MSHTSQTPPSVLISLLGRFELRVGGREMAAIPRKARALLAYLAMQDGRPVPREAMADLLWTDRGAEQARHSLRQTLLVLRRELRGAGGEVIHNDDRGLAFMPGMVQTDTDRLPRLIGSTDPGDLAEAAQLCTQPFLAGFPAIAAQFDDWLAGIRARMTESAADVLERLIETYFESGNQDEAVRAAERLLALDPLREDLHRRLMSVYANVGRRSDAIRQYNACVEMLRRELGVRPAAETDALVQRIKASEDGPSSRPTLDGNLQWRAIFAQPADGPPRIAVLPFLQFGDDPVPSHLSDGMVTDIVCQLAGLRELNVISHGSTLGLKDAGLDARSVGRMLGVRYVVAGSMRRSGHRLRLTTELAEADSGTVVWARSHDTDTVLSFEDQDRMVAQIVNTLAPRVHDMELHRIRGKRPESLSVYEKVLLAREHLLTMDHNAFLAARRLLTEATEAEPHYAEPYALLADFHGLIAAEGLSNDREVDVAAVERLTAKALSLDSNNLRALIFYAHRKSLLQRDYVVAQDLFHRALDVGPNSAQAWLWSSYVFSWIGETDEALLRAYRALELSPHDRKAHDFYAAICTAHYTAGNYRDAADWGLRALGEQSVMRGTYRWTAASLAALGQIDQAQQIMGESMGKVPNQRVSEVVRGHPYRDVEQRQKYGEHLLAAGFPP
jgi:DNA-binding SARP family transcriptional activator/TolB-like protein